MKHIKLVEYLLLFVLTVNLITIAVIFSKENKKSEKIDTAVKVVDNYNFRVRSKATAEVYTAVAARIGKNGEMKIKIYNYYTDKYEWYPIYKFYKYIAIATYVDKKYAQEKFGTIDTDIDFIDFCLYDEREL